MSVQNMRAISFKMVSLSTFSDQLSKKKGQVTINLRHMSKKIDALAIFLRDYSNSYNGREISRRIKVSPQTALTVLNSLVAEKVLSVQRDGRNKVYSLNKSNLLTKQMLQVAEISKASMILNDSEFRLIIETLIPFAETIVVFGSFAKGKQKESSDLDLIIINGQKEKIRSAVKIFPREINFELSTWKSYADSFRKKNTLAMEVIKDHLIYGNVFKVVEVYCQ
ncbi:hypothetical protein COV20_01275 [Candidatus Woesearchaeota archaeon CG10_big_fil_rev_8_21_14_0_10_45_16]|nr:MAG: hypothetical protein COV20_01275 [Candidatus Woesearchaeota archaeon CG10_big_fil_rev_8_21_14_0_10_45_16]